MTGQITDYFSLEDILHYYWRLIYKPLPGSLATGLVAEGVVFGEDVKESKLKGVL